MAQARRFSAGSRLVPAKWLAAGCLLIAREAYLKVMEVCADEAIEGHPFPFFSARAGEDVAFCRRLVQAGVPLALDTELVVAHRSSSWHLPEHTLPARRVP